MATYDDEIVAPVEVQLVAFKLKNEEYGFNILNVQEIKELTDITRVPFAADYIKGVINLRGSVLPVIDLKRRLGIEDTPYTTIKYEDPYVGLVYVGMLVDAVTEVRTIDEDDIDTNNRNINSDANEKFVYGVGKIDTRLIIMLDIKEVIGPIGEG